MSETGRMLHDARVRRGWSQSQLGRIAGIPQSVVSAYESGAREPSAAALRRLGRAMEMELALVDLRGPRKPDPSAMARQLEDVLGLVDAMHLRPRRQPLDYPVLSRL